LFTIMAGVIGVATATADRGILGLSFQTRTICDTELRPDGSWGRTRAFWVLAPPGADENPRGSYSDGCVDALKDHL
jgi:hypothetical protein